MATPTEGQFRDYNGGADAGPGLAQESALERILTVLATQASGTNPDGTAFTPPTVKVTPTAAVAANILVGQSSVTATQVATTFMTIPLTRVWVGTITVQCSVANVGAGTTAGLAEAVVTVAGTGVTPAAGTLVQCDAQAGANVAGGTVGDSGSASVTVPMTIIAGSGAATLQLTTTVTGTAGKVNVTASGALQ